MSRYVPVEQYFDLRVYDRNPQEVYEDALLDLQLKLPEFTPREGTMEVMLLQSMALEVAELIFTINRLPRGMIEILLRMLGLDRDPGAKPIATATFNVIDGLGHTIPAGTLLRLPTPTGTRPILFTTDVDLVILPTFYSGVAAITGVSLTSLANNTNTGTVLDLMDQIIYVSSVVLATDIEMGLDKEDGTTFLTRGVNRLSRLSDTLVLPQHFTAYAVEQPYVSKATTLDMYTPANDLDNNGPVGVDPGHVTVAVYGFDEPLSSDRLLELENGMEPLALGNLDVHVINPTLNEQDVTVTVKKVSTFDTAVVTASVIEAIEAFLSTETWDWRTTISRNDLIVAIGNAYGVQSVTTLAVPAADVTLVGVAPLVSVGSITITVND